VSQYKLLKDFIVQYSWCWALDEFHAEAEEPDLSGREEDPDKEPLTLLEIRWRADYSDYGQGPASVEIYPDFHGVSSGGKNGIRYWSVSFIPMYELANLPVKLNKSVQFFAPDDVAQRREPLVKGERDFRLEDVLDAIYWDISFHGSPRSRREKFDELAAICNDIKEGRAETVPLEFDDRELDGR